MAFADTFGKYSIDLISDLLEVGPDHHRVRGRVGVEGAWRDLKRFGFVVECRIRETYGGSPGELWTEEQFRRIPQITLGARELLEALIDLPPATSPHPDNSHSLPTAQSPLEPPRQSPPLPP